MYLSNLKYFLNHIITNTKILRQRQPWSGPFPKLLLINIAYYLIYPLLVNIEKYSINNRKDLCVQRLVGLSADSAPHLTSVPPLSHLLVEKEEEADKSLKLDAPLCICMCQDGPVGIEVEYSITIYCKKCKLV